MGVTGPGKTCQKKKQKSVIWENNLFQNIIEGNTGSENWFFCYKLSGMTHTNGETFTPTPRHLLYINDDKKFSFHIIIPFVF